MKDYIATFHTHLAALRSSRAVPKLGAVKVCLSPVPRKLSSSCGTCLRYSANEPCISAMDSDVDSIVEVVGEEEYQLVYKAEE